MATGYTYPVAEGELTSAPEFIRRCARAMGALVMLRDEPLSAPIPDTLPTSSSYNQDRLVEIDGKLAQLDGLRSEELDRMFEEAREAAITRDHERFERARVERVRLKNMRDAISDWTPPRSDFFTLKNFMLEQLDLSLRVTTPPIGLNTSAFDAYSGPEEWLQKQRTDLASQRAACVAAIAKEQDNDASRQEWWDVLRESLEGMA